MRIFKKIISALFFGITALSLTALSIDAVDNYDRLSESIIGRLVLGPAAGPCPDDMVFVPSASGDFCLDRYEASAGPDCPIAEPSSQSDTLVNINFENCRPVSVSGVRPWRFVSQNQAAVACAKSGKRLPKNQEWQGAALGTPDPDADWGPEACQVAKNWPEQPGPTGSGRDCRSPAGAYDLVGNVWEWIAETAIDGRVDERILPPEGYVAAMADDGWPSETSGGTDSSDYHDDFFWLKPTDVRAIARGGYWDNQEKGGSYSAYVVLEPKSSGAGIGFRCAR